MSKLYVLLSTKHMTDDTPVFWCADDCGYTQNPFEAGIYTEEQIKADPSYYNDGQSVLPVERSHAGLRAIGLECTVDLDKVAAKLKEVANG